MPKEKKVLGVLDQKEKITKCGCDKNIKRKK